MKTLKKALLVAVAAAFVLPLLEGCKKGPNDPGISLKSRVNRISALWNLSGGSYSVTTSVISKLIWSDSDCEDWNGQEFDENINMSDNYTFSSSSIGVNKSGTTSWDWATSIDSIMGSVGCCCAQVGTPGGEWEDAQSISRSATTTFDLTIKKDGTYDVSITWTLYDQDAYIVGQPDVNGEDQQGINYSGTYTSSGNWWWNNANKKKNGITFENFPFLMIGCAARYEFNIVSLEWDFDYNYASGISVYEETTTFDIDRLANKELTLMVNSTDTESTTEKTDEFDDWDINMNNIDCEGTVTTTTTTTITGQMDFTSDGKNVKE